MKEHLKKNIVKRLFVFILAFAVIITGFPQGITSVTAKAAEDEEEPYIISAGRPAYASSQNGALEAGKAFDGDLETRWQAEKEDKNEWIYTDLGKTAKITKIYLKWQEASASEYRVQFSDDEFEWKDVYKVTGAKEWDERTIKLQGSARYVRIQCDKRATEWGCSLFEFQVYGTGGLAPRPEDYGGNIALNKDTKASASRLEWWMRVPEGDNWENTRDNLFENGYPVDEEGNLITDKSKIFAEDGFLRYEKGKNVLNQKSVLPSNATDGLNNADCWHPNGGDASKRNYDEWIYVDLGAEYDIGRIILKWKDAARAYRIEVSGNASDWKPIYSKMNDYALNKNIPIHAKGRYVRVYCIAPWDFSSGFGISEIEVYKYREGIDKDITYEIEEEPEVKSVSVQGSDATYATDDVRFPMAKPPLYLDESLQMPQKPVASNDWWQTVTIKDLGDGLVALPYRTKYTEGGLDITLVNDCWYASEGGAGQVGSAVVNSKTDITIVPEGISTGRIYDKITDYSDFAIKAQLCDTDGPVMTNTIIKGSPYIFSEFGDKQDIVIYSANITEVFDKYGNEALEEQNKDYTTDCIGLLVTDDDNKKKTKTSDSFFCINFPAGTTVKRAGSKLKIHFRNKNAYMSVGAMTGKNDIMTFYQHGYAFVTDTSVTYNYDEQVSKVTTYYKMETEVKRAGFNNTTIQCLFPHQYKKLSSGSPVNDNWSYITSRGTMKGCILEDNQFETQDTFYGMVPQFTRPQDTEDTILADGTVIPGYSDELVAKYLSQIEKNTHNIESLPGGDAYWQGKSLHPLALATLVADQNGNVEYRDMFLERLRYIFDDWFTYSGQDDDVYFYYDKNWGTLYYRYSEFGANWGICDHHFTYGYFLFAASVLATYDDAFYEQYKEMLDLIVRDFASPYEDDNLFCRFRSFDLYEGHSWAGGYADNDTGNNQEAGGESLFGWVGMYLWSVRSNNKDFRDAAIFGFTTELNDVEQYWFNYDGDNWPEDWPHYIVGQNYGASIFYGTFFDGNATSIYGIHWLPVTEWISHYSMGEHRKKGLINMYEGLLKEIDAQRDAESEENKSKVKTTLTNWQHIFVPLKAQYDPDGALDDYWKVCNGEVKNGEGAVVDFDSTEQFNAYWFAHSMKDLGNKTDEIWPVGGVSASVYKKGSTYTAIAWNPTEDDMYIEFTDGEKIVGSATIGSKSLVRFDPFAKDIIQVSTPEFSLASDTYEDTQYLKITTGTEGAQIHYTTDGSNPSQDSPLYTGRIPVSSTTTIKAVALKDGYIDSKMEAVTIKINGSTITTGKNIAAGKQAEASSGDNSAGNITDGSAKTRWETAQESDGTYNPANWCTIDLGEEYNINKVKISWEAAYASKYKIQVSTDNQEWMDVYIEDAGDGGFDEIIFEPEVARYVRMQGVERGSAYGYSIYEMGVYEARQIATPQFSLSSGTYSGNQMLSLASGTRAVEIHYTTDGTEPTKDSPLYIPRLELWKDTVVKAKAFKLGMVPSMTAEASYIITGGTQPDTDGGTYNENDPFQP